jgi:hypothetical protein
MPAHNPRILLKGAAVVAVPGLVLGGLILTLPLGLDCVTGPSRDLSEAAREEERLVDVMRVIERIEEAKHGVVRDLLAERLTLPEAAARFRDLDREQPGFNWVAFRRTYPCDTDDERHCREVLAWVRCAERATQPDRRSPGARGAGD